MPTFKKKPEIVDARQFTGGAQDGMNLVLWVRSGGAQAFWSDSFAAGEREKVYVEESRYDLTPAFVDDWIVKHQNGSFEVVRPELFNETYQQL